MDVQPKIISSDSAVERRESSGRRRTDVVRIAQLEADLARERAARAKAEDARDAALAQLAALKKVGDRAVQTRSPEPKSPRAEAPSEDAKDAAQATAPAVQQPAPAVQQPAPVEPIGADKSAGADKKDKRTDRRMLSRFPATYWRPGMSSPSSCTIRDMSNGGAKLELAADAVHSRMKELSVGDQLTLSIETTIERTSVECAVMWVAGNRCGVKFRGQFHNSFKAPKTPMMRPEPAKPAAGRKSLFRFGS